MESVKAAVEEYLRRLTRRSHPSGSFDRVGRFTLAQQFDCCAGIRCPSRSWPWSQMTHGRTLRHVAQEFDVGEKALRKAVKAARES